MMPLKRNIRKFIQTSFLIFFTFNKWSYRFHLKIYRTSTCSSLLTWLRRSYVYFSNLIFFCFLQLHCHLFSSPNTLSSFRRLRAFAHPILLPDLPSTTASSIWDCSYHSFLYHFTLSLCSAYQNLKKKFFLGVTYYLPFSTPSGLLPCLFWMLYITSG